MLIRFSNILHKAAKGWLIFILLILNLVFDILILPLGQAMMKFDAGGPGPIDLLFVYIPARAYEMVAAYGDYGRDLLSKFRAFH